jgi:hypothetical protein
MTTSPEPQLGAHFLGADGHLHIINEVLSQLASAVLAGLYTVRDQHGFLFTIHMAADHNLTQSPTEWVEVHVLEEHTMTPGERDAVGKGVES